MTQYDLSNWLHWAHDTARYKEIFALTDADLAKSILECPLGPTAFVAEQLKAGAEVKSVNSLYAESPDTVTQLVTSACEKAKQAYIETLSSDLFDKPSDLDRRIADKQAAVELFLNHFGAGFGQENYLSDDIFNLPFENQSFGLALVSYQPFYYPTLDFTQILAMCNELCRVAKEVRIFPLVEVGKEMSEHVGPLMIALQTQGHGVEVKAVDFSFRKAGNAMMRLWPQQCDV